MSVYWLLPIFYGFIVFGACCFVGGVVYGVKCKTKRNTRKGDKTNE